MLPVSPFIPGVRYRLSTSSSLPLFPLLFSTAIYQPPTEKGTYRLTTMFSGESKPGEKPSGTLHWDHEIRFTENPSLAGTLSIFSGSVREEDAFDSFCSKAASTIADFPLTGIQEALETFMRDQVTEERPCTIVVRFDNKIYYITNDELSEAVLFYKCIEDKTFIEKQLNTVVVVELSVLGTGAFLLLTHGFRIEEGTMLNILLAYRSHITGCGPDKSIQPFATWLLKKPLSEPPSIPRRVKLLYFNPDKELESPSVVEVTPLFSPPEPQEITTARHYRVDHSHFHEDLHSVFTSIQAYGKEGFFCNTRVLSFLGFPCKLIVLAQSSEPMLPFFDFFSEIATTTTSLLRTHQKPDPEVIARHIKETLFSASPPSTTQLSMLLLLLPLRGEQRVLCITQGAITAFFCEPLPDKGMAITTLSSDEGAPVAQVLNTGTLLVSKDIPSLQTPKDVHQRVASLRELSSLPRWCVDDAVEKAKPLPLAAAIFQF